MRKLLCGIAVGVFALTLFAGVASAAEGGTISKSEAAEEMKAAGERAGLDDTVVECIENAAKNDDADRCVESPSPIMPAKNELIYGGLAFLALLVVLWKFGVPAASKMMTERTEKIRASLDEADRAKTEAETILAEYQRQLADARAESTRIIEEARGQAEEVRRDLVARAEAEAADLRQRNAEQVGAERDRVMGEMQGQVAALAIELAEKVVESNLDRETNTRLIENYISSVGARS
jgi:F-type H+-transporting ATPase subunit b